MLKILQKIRTLSGTRYAAWGFTALGVLGVMRVLGLAGTMDYQNAVGQPGMPVPALLLQLALAVGVTAIGWYGRKYCLRAAAEKRCALLKSDAQSRQHTAALNSSMRASV